VVVAKTRLFLLESDRHGIGQKGPVPLEVIALDRLGKRLVRGADHGWCSVPGGS